MIYNSWEHSMGYIYHRYIEIDGGNGINNFWHLNTDFMILAKFLFSQL